VGIPNVISRALKNISKRLPYSGGFFLLQKGRELLTSSYQIQHYSLLANRMNNMDRVDCLCDKIYFGRMLRNTNDTKSRQHQKTFILNFAIALILPSIFIACRQDAPIPPEVAQVDSVAVVHRPDFKSIKSISKRKEAFVAYLNPFIAAENKSISESRLRIITIRDEFKRLCFVEFQDSLWLRELCGQYKFRAKFDYHQERNWKRLLTRVDIVPYEIALSQAALESAWGTSRFATEGKNYFGQWCYQPGCGLVPRNRQPGMKHEVRVFDSAAGSVRAYMRNLNTNSAYASFRKLRDSNRDPDVKLDALILADGLMKYSSRGEEYVKSIRIMIRVCRALLGKLNKEK
jgi:Bax protein